MTYDVIGDIHGHAEELRTLLRQLGYEERNGGYVAEGRNAIFVGDFIDRGPAIREVLQIARAMVTRNGAYAVLGNHEFNALCYHTPDAVGSFLRPHSTVAFIGLRRVVMIGSIFPRISLETRQFYAIESNTTKPPTPKLRIRRFEVRIPTGAHLPLRYLRSLVIRGENDA